jgi:hypothetical protein
MDVSTILERTVRFDSFQPRLCVCHESGTGVDLEVY